jgi:hypothetical protein
VKNLVKDGRKKIVMNMANVMYIDSVGLGVSSLGLQREKLSSGVSNSPVFAGFTSLIPPHWHADREQEDGTLAFRVRRKELNHVIVEKR